MKKVMTKVLFLMLVTLVTLNQTEATIDTENADAVAKIVWETSQESHLTKEDSIANLAWSSQVDFMPNLAGEENYSIIACAADLENQQEKNEYDKLSANIWVDAYKKDYLSREDNISYTAWLN